MKGRSLNTAAAALTAAVLLTSAACAGEFPTGRFAVQNNGHFHNFTTFNCIDRGPTFCENLNRKKLSDEEKKYIQGVNIPRPATCMFSTTACIPPPNVTVRILTSKLNAVTARMPDS